ncbi:MAG: ADOP family duplicated permease [Candidatus Korobacteraceae bacterium]|jgi:putative ABC transport system permease protein
MIGLFQDLRYALRQLRKHPGFTATVVLTLGLGIGASAAIFSLIDAFWLRPLAVPHQQELVRIFSTTQQDQEGLFSFQELEALQQNVRSLKSVVAIGRRGSSTPRPDGTLQELFVNVVSSNFFDGLGVEPLVGRVFTSSDTAMLQNTPVAVLGYGFWQRQFSGDPSIVGKSLTLVRGGARIPVEIVGVLPSSFREVENGMDRDIWVPQQTWLMMAGPKEPTGWDFRWFNALGRLAPGATVAQAQTELTSVARALELSHPEANRNRSISVIGDLRYRLHNAGATGALLFAVVGLVVLLCVVNIANLLLARELARGRDAAIRVALGGSRANVFEQSLVENLLLGLLALGTGLCVAMAIAALLPRILARMLTGPAMLDLPPGSVIVFHTDARVITFAGVLTLVTFLALACVQLWQLSCGDMLEMVRSGGSLRNLGGKAPRFRRALLSGQIAISLILLIATGVLVRSFVNTQTGPIGLTRNNVLVAFCALPSANGMVKSQEAIHQFYALGGVKQVAYAIRSPLMPSEGGLAQKIFLPGHPELHEAPEIKYNAVSATYLAVTGTRILAGRGFTAQDDVSGPPVAVINRTMARRYWGSQDPIGQTVRLASPAMDARIVGIAEDAPINAIGELPEPYFYVPYRFAEYPEITFLIASAPEAMTLAQPARDIVIHIDPQFGPIMVTSLGELLQSSASNYQVTAELVTALGVVGLLLTVVGLSGFLMYRVQQRTSEIGLRVALGSSQLEVTALILRETLHATLIGAVIGMPLALVGVRFASSMLFGVRPWDPLSILSALLALALITGATTLIPARRASRIDPVKALRWE